MDTFKCLIAAAVGLSLLGCGTQARDAAQIEKEVLLERSESWDGTPYKAYPSGPAQLTLIRLKIPARTQLPWHTHPMPNAAYIVSGELTVEARSSGATRTLRQGQTLAEMVGTEHRGVTGDTPVELLVFYAGTPGMPLSEQH
ncbi:cupin domain-containing protein [Pseudomonas reactans]|uniref:cupin domain-containing protein n=1 Tax=Pseudomonas reactans TaxID=117680 RepID=UPI0002EE23BD|nr:cupin domain-containing protein [Pseudomonas reactans]NWC85573.1 cupin domain-containing protein [Pseudomonas reactans]NWD29596.1 cupin domain-containing protein [Pseudomonas reactans]